MVAIYGMFVGLGIPMKMKISKVTLDPAYQQTTYDKKIKAIVMDVAVENTSDQTISWFPAQGKLVLNTNIIH